MQVDYSLGDAVVLLFKSRFEGGRHSGWAWRKEGLRLEVVVVFCEGGGKTVGCQSVEAVEALTLAQVSASCLLPCR